MRIASIDIGTNTILMLIADVQVDNTLVAIRDEHVIARLGAGVDRNKRILPETIRRVEGVLRAYLAICRQEQCEKILAAGTSALRDAANRKEFLDHIARTHGLSIRVLSGEEEARLTYLGAVSGTQGIEDGRPLGVLDIGGGSTEVILGEGLNVRQALSADVGAVRLTERCFRTLPPSEEDLRRAQAFVRTSFRELPPIDGGRTFLGVAGTLTTLAALDLQLKAYDRARVEGHLLSYERVSELFDRLRGLSLPELLLIPQILPQRADIILAGVVILHTCMTLGGIPVIRVSDRGLRYGLAMEALAS